MLKPNAFRKDLILMARDNFIYLGIEEGPRLVLFWLSPKKVRRQIKTCLQFVLCSVLLVQRKF
jgi:hypothetical protein